MHEKSNVTSVSINEANEMLMKSRG